MKNFLSSIADKWQIVSESDAQIEVDYSKIDDALYQTATMPNTVDDFDLDDVEDF